MDIDLDLGIVTWAFILLFGACTVLFIFLSYKQIVRTYPLVGINKFKGALVLALDFGICMASILIVYSLIISQGKLLAALFYFVILAPLFLPIVMIAGVAGFYFSTFFRRYTFKDGEYDTGQDKDEPEH